MAMASLWASLAPTPAQGFGQLLLDQFLDEAADPLSPACLDRVEPCLARKQRCRLELAVIFVHGVISAGASTPVMAL